MDRTSSQGGNEGLATDERDRLADIYGISAVHGEFEDESYVVPWKANGPGDGGATP